MVEGPGQKEARGHRPGLLPTQWACTWWRGGREREAEQSVHCEKRQNWRHDGGEYQPDVRKPKLPPKAMVMSRLRAMSGSKALPHQGSVLLSGACVTTNDPLQWAFAREAVWTKRYTVWHTVASMVRFLFCLVFIYFLLWGGYKGGGQIKKDWEMNVTGYMTWNSQRINFFNYEKKENAQNSETVEENESIAFQKRNQPLLFIVNWRPWDVLRSTHPFTYLSTYTPSIYISIYLSNHPPMCPPI